MSNLALGTVIRKLRRAASVSQEELAHRAGIHPTYVSQLERGLKSPTAMMLSKLAKALGTTPSQLLKMAESNKR